MGFVVRMVRSNSKRYQFFAYIDPIMNAVFFSLLVNRIQATTTKKLSTIKMHSFCCCCCRWRAIFFSFICHWWFHHVLFFFTSHILQLYVCIFGIHLSFIKFFSPFAKSKGYAKSSIDVNPPVALYQKAFFFFGLLLWSCGEKSEKKIRNDNYIFFYSCCSFWT